LVTIPDSQAAPNQSHSGVQLMVVPLVLDRSIVDLKLEDATAFRFAGTSRPPSTENGAELS
jgi:hypothetical protein